MDKMIELLEGTIKMFFIGIITNEKDMERVFGDKNIAYEIRAVYKQYEIPEHYYTIEDKNEQRGYGHRKNRAEKRKTKEEEKREIFNRYMNESARVAITEILSNENEMEKMYKDKNLANEVREIFKKYGVQFYDLTKEDDSVTDLIKPRRKQTKKGKIKTNI
jgi:hypothetical protein